MDDTGPEENWRATGLIGHNFFKVPGQNAKASGFLGSITPFWQSFLSLPWLQNSIPSGMPPDGCCDMGWMLEQCTAAADISSIKIIVSVYEAVYEV